MKEYELYEPVRVFLEAQGYEVQAEVKDCDVVGKKGDALVIVELKTSFRLALVYQAIARQTLTEQVFVAIPRPEGSQRTKAYQNMIRLLKRLELGLLLVAMDGPLQQVEVALEPADSLVRKNKRKQAGLAKELAERSFAQNIGGVNQRKLMTAYRERAYALACLLEVLGQASPKQMRLENEAFPAMVRSNAYGWFVRIEKGVYGLSEAGYEALCAQEPVIAHYRAVFIEAYAKD